MLGLGPGGIKTGDKSKGTYSQPRDTALLGNVHDSRNSLQGQCAWGGSQPMRGGPQASRRSVQRRGWGRNEGSKNGMGTWRSR